MYLLLVVRCCVCLIDGVQVIVVLVMYVCSYDIWLCLFIVFFFFFKQKTAYEMRISDWSSDVCSSDLEEDAGERRHRAAGAEQAQRFAGKAFGARGKGGEGVARDLAHMGIGGLPAREAVIGQRGVDRKSTRLNSSH